MSALKDQLQADLTTSMKSRDELTSATIRMVLTAITNEEVAGKEARELSDDDVMTVLSREAKKRREAATAYEDAGANDRAQRERDELSVIQRYLPEELTAAELVAIITAAVAQAQADGAQGPKAMGAVMKVVQPQVKGRADGQLVAKIVKEQLSQ